MIISKNITKYYGEQCALNNVSFEAKKGEILGLLGPNGAGKSTLMKIMTGYIAADSGEVEVCGELMGVNKPHLQHLIGYLPEHNPLYLDMYVKQYLHYVAGLYKIDTKQADAVLADVGLLPECHKRIKQLSKGYRQRVGLAQALLHNPEVLILDEPTTGLDPNQILEIRDLIRKVAQDKVVIISTHIMQEVESICDKVLIISKGNVVANDTVQHVLDAVKVTRLIDIEFATAISAEQIQTMSDHIVSVQLQEDNRFVIELDVQDDMRAQIAQYAMSQGWVIVMMKSRVSGLEDVFSQLTK